MANTTTGMSDDYSIHDEYQRSVAAAARIPVESAARRAAVASSGTFVIVNYGCATNPHGAMLHSAIAAVRMVDSAREIVVVHNDLPTNNWNALCLAAIDKTSGYTTGWEAAPLTMLSASSFFGPVVPRASVQLGLSFSAAHWLRSQPEMQAGSWCFCDAQEPARSLLAAQAAADWEQFLKARAHELAPGAMLIVETIGTAAIDDNNCVTARELLQFMRTIAQDLVTEGNLDSAVFDRFVFPTYARTAAEAAVPFASGRVLASCFDVESVEVFPVPNPYLELMRRGDIAQYAESYVAFVKAFTAHTLSLHLFDPGARGCAGSDLLDEFYRRMRDRIAADPSQAIFRDWTLRVVLHRCG